MISSVEPCSAPSSPAPAATPTGTPVTGRVPALWVGTAVLAAAAQALAIVRWPPAQTGSARIDVAGAAPTDGVAHAPAAAGRDVVIDANTVGAAR